MVKEKEDELELKEKQLEALQGLIRDCSEQLLCKDKELGRIQKLIEEASDTFNAKEKEIASIQVLVGEFMEELDVKEKLYDVKKKSIEDCDVMLKAKMEETELIEATIEAKKEELELIKVTIEAKKQEFGSLQESVLKCLEDIESGRKELSLVENYSKSLSDQSEENQLQLDLVQTLTREHLINLREKEKQLNLLSESLEKRTQDIETKEKQPEEEHVNKARFHVSPTHSCLKGNERNLQFFLNEHLIRHDLVFHEITNTLKTPSVLAKMVLEAMQGFYPQEGQVEFDVGVVRMSCILLLDMLCNSSIEINPSVRGEALKLACEWKEKINATVEGLVEILVFLQLLAAFQLGPHFGKNELQSLLDVVSPYRQASILRQALGVTIEVPGITL